MKAQSYTATLKANGKEYRVRVRRATSANDAQNRIIHSAASNFVGMDVEISDLKPESPAIEMPGFLKSIFK